MTVERHLQAPVLVGGAPLVCVPYINGMISSETRAWAQDHEARLTELDERDEAYFELMCNLWEHPGDLVLIEQDVLPNDNSVEEMLACDSDWCCCPYPISGGGLYGWGLGCTKFSERLRRQHPDVMQKAGLPGDYDPEPARAWWVLDVRLTCLLSRFLPGPHGHQEVSHLRPLGAQ